MIVILGTDMVLSLLGCYNILFFSFCCPYLFLEECDSMVVWYGIFWDTAQYIHWGSWVDSILKYLGLTQRNVDGQEEGKVRGYAG